MAEYSSSGLWAIEPTGPFRHGMVSYEALDLPEELAQRFREWISRYWLRLDGKPFDVEAFNAMGRALAQELKQVVGPAVYVEFVPERPDGGIGAAEEVG